MTWQKLLLTLSILILIIFFLAGESFAANRFILGLSFPISGSIEFQKPLPYISLQVEKSHPNAVNKFRANEDHHLYWGAILLTAGLISNSRSMKVIGGLVVFDDVIQHAVRIQSPLHLIDSELYKYKIIRDLNF